MGLLRSFLVGFHCMGGSNMAPPWGGSYVIKKESFIMNLTLNACINRKLSTNFSNLPFEMDMDAQN